MGGKRPQFRNRLRKPVQFHRPVRRRFRKNFLYPQADVFQRLIESFQHGSVHPSGQNDAVNQRRTDNPQHDFLHPRQGCLEQGRFAENGNVRQNRQGDDRHRITRQHESVGSGSPVQQGNVKAYTDPDTENDRQQYGIPDESRHDQHGHDRSDNRPGHPVNGLGTGRSRKGLRNDISRNQRPERAGQPQPERQIQRQHGRHETLD